MTPPVPALFVPALQTVVLISAAIILILAEPAINRMSPCSPFLTRLAFHCLAVGAAGNLLWVTLGDAPSWPETVILAGIALMLVRDRLRPRVAGDRRARPLDTGRRVEDAP